MAKGIIGAKEAKRAMELPKRPKGPKKRRKKTTNPKTQEIPTIEITESQDSPKRRYLHQQEKSLTYPILENNSTKSSHIIEGIALPHACQRCEIYEAHLKIIKAQFEALQGEINRLNNDELNQHES